MKEDVVEPRQVDHEVLERVQDAVMPALLQYIDENRNLLGCADISAVALEISIYTKQGWVAVTAESLEHVNDCDCEDGHEHANDDGVAP